MPDFYKLAMDAALDLEQARRDCAPFIGDVDMSACESPSDMYEAVLKAKGVDTEGVDESAYPALLKMLKRIPSGSGPAAMDSKSYGVASAAIETDFPMVARIVA